MGTSFVLISLHYYLEFRAMTNNNTTRILIIEFIVVPTKLIKLCVFWITTHTTPFDLISALIVWLIVKGLDQTNQTCLCDIVYIRGSRINNQQQANNLASCYSSFKELFGSASYIILFSLIFDMAFQIL